MPKFSRRDRLPNAPYRWEVENIVFQKYLYMCRQGLRQMKRTTTGCVVVIQLFIQKMSSQPLDTYCSQKSTLQVTPKLRLMPLIVIHLENVSFIKKKVPKAALLFANYNFNGPQNVIHASARGKTFISHNSHISIRKTQSSKTVIMKS